MKSADDDRNTGLPERTRNVHGAGKLVRLHADEPDHAETVVLAHQFDDPVDPNARIGFVGGGDLDGDARAEDSPVRCIGGERIDTGQ